MLADGRRLRLQGLSAPAPVVRPEAAGRLSAHLAEHLVGRRVLVQAEAENARDDGVDLTGLVRLEEDAERTVNEAVLEEGLAVFSTRSPHPIGQAALLAAARRAQRARRGLFARTPPRRLEQVPALLNGAVLGLYYKVARRRYHRQIDELADMGFRHLCLVFPLFVRDVRSSSIVRDHARTPTDERLLETIAYARGKGFSILLMPILLLLEAGEDDWRGTLRPADPGRFWLAYDRALAHYADLAEAGGVDVLSVGSELGSLEPNTRAWRRVIDNARGRFSGLLTYSANWDHAHVPRFFDALDFVGMTAYFSLTEKRDPSLEELVAAWRRVAAQLRPLAARTGKKIVFTELGYASQDGINRDPWNYTMNEDRLDLEEQAACFEAFLRVVPEMDYLAGAYFYEYFSAGGPADPGYSPRGKPAVAQWRRWATYRR